MSVPIAYVAIIMIWSTTPLAIKWSGAGVGHEFGVASRMLLGLLLLLLYMWIRSISFPWDRQARHIYVISGLSLFFAMASVYWAAQFIPSGWISVVFGISPIITGIVAVMILKQRSFSEGRLLGMTFSIGGLAIIFIEGLEISQAAWLGVLGVVFSAIAQPVGAVLLKKYRPTISAIAITSGSLVIATPLFVLSWLLFGPDSLIEPDLRTLGAIVFLAVVGTSVGFPLYYYVLKHLSAGHVSLITLITPVTALLLGAALNGELISDRVWLGTALILFGLLVHEHRKLYRLLNNRF